MEGEFCAVPRCSYYNCCSAIIRGFRTSIIGEQWIPCWETSTQELVLNNWYPNRRVRREPQRNPLVDSRTALEQKEYSVVNFSAQQLTQSHIEVLTWAINVEKVATAFEYGSRNVAATNNLGRQLFEKYVTKKRCDTGSINLNKQHLKALSGIRHMHDVVIKPSDKGG
ncbi:hypothetical protein GJ496_006071 [Pomphorhynchus laevis]|nr:hypothetical protein GJ496_006071 [Pomphorhynchus laevis]